MVGMVVWLLYAKSKQGYGTHGMSMNAWHEYGETAWHEYGKNACMSMNAWHEYAWSCTRYAMRMCSNGYAPGILCVLAVEVLCRVHSVFAVKVMCLVCCAYVQ